MRRRVVFVMIFVFGLGGRSFGGSDVEIRYETVDWGWGTWQYVYEVENVSLTDGIEEFTIWFDYGEYENLAVNTLDPPAGDWDEIVVQPEPVLEDDGFYDALALVDAIGVGEGIYGFSVIFDWSGEGEPAAQYYEIVDPVTYETIADGWTVPEPGTLVLFGFGALLAVRRRADV